MFLELSNNLANELGHHFVWVHTVSPQLLTQVYRAIYRTIGKNVPSFAKMTAKATVIRSLGASACIGVESGSQSGKATHWHRHVWFGKSTVVYVSTAMLNYVELQESISFPKQLYSSHFVSILRLIGSGYLPYWFIYIKDGSSLKKGNTMRYPNVLSIGKACSFFPVFTVFAWLQRLNHMFLRIRTTSIKIQLPTFTKPITLQLLLPSGKQR